MKKIIIFLCAVVSCSIVYGVYGPNSKTLNTEAKITHFADEYSIGAAGEHGWTIKSAEISGIGWGFRCSHTGTGEGTHSVCGNSTSARAQRSLPGGSSKNLFSASISGIIVPPGGGGSPHTYIYSVTGIFKGELSIDPHTKIIPLGGGGPSYRLLTTYDGEPHPIYGYWKTDPDYRMCPHGYDSNGAAHEDPVCTYFDWNGPSDYGGVSSFPGIFTIKGAAHSDGGDEASYATMKVSAVKILKSGDVESKTDGWERDEQERHIKDDKGNYKTQDVPTVYANKRKS